VEGPDKKGNQFKFEFVSKISEIFGKRDPEKRGTSRKFENGKYLDSLIFSGHKGVKVVVYGLAQ